MNSNKEIDGICVYVFSRCAMNANRTEHMAARLATLDELLKTLIPAYLTPAPGRESLRDWFDRARIPRFKANPTAKRGGGTVFYSVAAVEKFLQSRTLPCRLPAVSFPTKGRNEVVGGAAN